ncbi:FAD-dependent oxidoreductase [Novosphingobium sp. Leaf2]|uniref:FAD-dependent oxidoreductase n=1 Tax=Novosphingobium sp. Leaf2 TaxID=1735670 RepID=UPI0006FB27B4|nr:FAD-dependent oxidoreductase [Novosphingobium sp. Leaf2]KQM22210.1 fumarate reductase [Novosphingobium sp. Leaf2]
MSEAEGFEFSVPVLIAGAGACGAVAALAALNAGVTPLVIERDDRPGGSTGMSQGLFCAAGTQSQREHGIEDNADIFFADIIEKAKGQTDPVIARALADHSAPTLEWLRAAHDLPWELDLRFRASYGNSRQRLHGWPGHSGDDMVQLLHRRMSDAGVDVLMETRLVDIYVQGDRIIGVALERADGAIEKVGCDALVLACGGFGANRAMTDRYMPETATLKYNGHEGSQGEAIVVAERLGAVLADMGSYQGYAMLTDPQGISVPPPVLIEGGIIVNKLGNRFTDESADIAGMVHPLAGQPDGLGWVIYDARIEERCAQIPELAQLMALNAPKIAEDLETLAKLTSTDPAQLAAAVGDVQRVAAAKGTDAFGRSWASETPPSGPYRALKVTGALYHTQGGLQIDGAARVLRQDGTPFANLFAGGGSARSVSGPSSWGYLPAMGLTTAVVLGRLAGEGAARASAD